MYAKLCKTAVKNKYLTSKTPRLWKFMIIVYFEFNATSFLLILYKSRLDYYKFIWQWFYYQKSILFNFPLLFLFLFLTTASVTSTMKP